MPDAGEIRVDGQRLDLRSPADAIRAGIGMVHQHFVLVPSFTVLENIVVGTGFGLRLDLAQARRRIGELCTRLGLDINVDRQVSSLSVGEMQWVEIVKSLYLGARLLILDEPTAVLTPQESDRLFALMADLKASGISIILISHKMNEVMRSRPCQRAAQGKARRHPHHRRDDARRTDRTDGRAHGAERRARAILLLRREQACRYGACTLTVPRGSLHYRCRPRCGIG